VVIASLLLLKMKESSIETGDGCFELHYDYSNA
jgi:hypothetical protein